MCASNIFAISYNWKAQTIPTFHTITSSYRLLQLQSSIQKYRLPVYIFLFQGLAGTFICLLVFLFKLLLQIQTVHVQLTNCDVVYNYFSYVNFMQFGSNEYKIMQVWSKCTKQVIYIYNFGVNGELPNLVITKKFSELLKNIWYRKAHCGITAYIQSNHSM